MCVVCVCVYCIIFTFVCVHAYVLAFVCVVYSSCCVCTYMSMCIYGSLYPYMCIVLCSCSVTFYLFELVFMLLCCAHFIYIVNNFCNGCFLRCI